MTIITPSRIESTPDDQQLVEYLLDLLPPEQTQRLDEASIADDAVAARLHIVEQDLVDTYVRGALAGETLERFESHYLASPRRREHVAFARRFVPAVDRAAIAAGVISSRARWRAGLMWSVGVAAAILVVVCGTLLFLSWRSGMASSVPHSEGALTLDRPEGFGPSAHPQDMNVPVEKAAWRAADSSTASPVFPIVALLSPQTRSFGVIPAFTIPTGVERVGFELRLESHDFPRYQVGLRDPAINRVVWSSEWIAATSRSGQASIVVAVPSGLLKPQHYSFDLTGSVTGAGSEIAGGYVFEITPR
jgi:hypothetical protein